MTKLRYRLNPCDIDRDPKLARIGDALAWVWEKFTAGTDCPCCLGTRLVVSHALAFGLAYLLA